jgi:hypothetical protein
LCLVVVVGDFGREVVAEEVVIIVVQIVPARKGAV